MDKIPRLSIIIPVAAHETAWKNLLGDLIEASFEGEILLVAQEEPSEADQVHFDKFSENSISWVGSPPGRASQLNKGAELARGEFLWFLHADTRLERSAVLLLMEAIHRNDRALYFFDLKFSADGPRTMLLNTIGVWIRSRLFRLPFGDQGLLLKRSIFVELGGYDISAPYGEDHLLVWKAHQSGLPVTAVGASISTSARKYRIEGWLKTTLKHLFLTLAQALPQLGILLKRQKIFKKLGARYE